MKENKKGRAVRPILAVRYRYELAVFDSPQDKRPATAKGGSADVRIDVLATAVAVALGAGGLALAMLAAGCKRAWRRSRK